MHVLPALCIPSGHLVRRMVPVVGERRIARDLSVLRGHATWSTSVVRVLYTTAGSRRGLRVSSRGMGICLGIASTWCDVAGANTDMIQNPLLVVILSVRGIQHQDIHG